MPRGFAPPTVGVSGDSSLVQNTLLEHFTHLSDPRIDRTKDHLLLDIVAIAILAVIAGADGWEAIETFGLSRQAWLAQFLCLPNGIPSHDTFRRVFARLDPQQFQHCFRNWVNALTESLGVQVIAIDGKALKQSYDRNDKLKALHLVSAWASDHRLVLAQVKVDQKSNEITAIPELLQLLDIKGCIITIDAMGAQKSIATQIIQKQADYVLTLKANHSKLHQAVQQWFEQHHHQGFADCQNSFHETIEAGHHRVEIRRYWSVPISALGQLSQLNQWSGLQSLGIAVRERRLWNKTTLEVRFYLSSLPSDAALLAVAVRSHWQIENTLHWTLDVTFSEDASRIRTGYGAENFALLRRISVNLLKQEKTFKGSLRMKRYKAALDNEYLLKILAASQPQPPVASSSNLTKT